MPRPRKCRRVCQLPDNSGFLPIRGGGSQDPVVLNVDEYEALRLIDREGLSQEECGSYMHVARTTVQQIYTRARKKLADALVEGRPIQISGGDYRLCDGTEQEPGCGRCHGRCWRAAYHKQGDGHMKIAIPLDENRQDVCPVLSRAPFFLFWEDGQEVIVENPAAAAQSGAGVQAAQYLVDSAITTLVTPRCGENAAQVFQAAGIKLCKSAHKAASDDLAACLDGSLDPLTHFHGGYHGLR